MKYAWLVIGMFAARFFATAVAFPSGDGDLAWQRWLGATVVRTHAIPRALGDETFSASGAPWVPQEWLFSVVANVARSGLAWDAFALGVALCAVAALVLAGLRARRLGASPVAVALCAAAGGVGLYQSFGVRAQVVAWPLLALYLLLLDCEGPWAYAAIGVAAVWSNVHASVVLAPLLAAAVAAERVVRARRFDPRARRAAIVAFGSLAATCCNPFGWHLPYYAVSLFGSPIKTFITEWKVTDLGDLSFAWGALPLLLAAMLICAGSGRTRAGNLVILAAFACLLLGAARNIALFSIVAYPIVAAALGHNFRWFAETGPPAAPTGRDRRAAFALSGAVVAAALVVGIQLLRSVPSEENLPERSLAALAKTAGAHRLFCADFAWCGLAVGMPNVRVFLDGRADPYPETVWQDFAGIVRVGAAWRTTLARRGVNAVLVARGAALDQALAETPDWHAQYRDARYRLWLRKSTDVARKASSSAASRIQ